MIYVLIRYYYNEERSLHKIPGQEQRSHELRFRYFKRRCKCVIIKLPVVVKITRSNRRILQQMLHNKTLVKKDHKNCSPLGLYDIDRGCVSRHIRYTNK